MLDAVAGTDDDLSSVGLGVSSTFDCWCIFFKLPLDGLPCGLISESNTCLGLLLCGGLEAEMTAGLDIGFDDTDETVVVAAVVCDLASSFFTTDGLFETFGMFFVLISSSFVIAVAIGFKSSPFFSALPGELFFFSRSGSSKFNARTVDDGFNRSFPASVSDSLVFRTIGAFLLPPSLVLFAIAVVDVVDTVETVGEATTATAVASADCLLLPLAPVDLWLISTMYIRCFAGLLTSKVSSSLFVMIRESGVHSDAI